MTPIASLILQLLNTVSPATFSSLVRTLDSIPAWTLEHPHRSPHTKISAPDLRMCRLQFWRRCPFHACSVYVHTCEWILSPLVRPLLHDLQDVECRQISWVPKMHLAEILHLQINGSASAVRSTYDDLLSKLLLPCYPICNLIVCGIDNHLLFFQSCWPTRDHKGRSTGISNPAWHLPQVVPRVVQTTGSVHP